MKQNLITMPFSVLSLSVMLMACGGGSSNNASSSSEDVPINNITNPLVSTPQTYTLTDLSASAASSDLITYKMLGVNGSEVQATALVFTPKTTPPQGGWPIVVWAHGTTGVADKCAPSRYPLAADQQTLFSQLLNAGYVVVAPDYEGMNGLIEDTQNHPFLNLKSEGFSITDAVVAARNLLGTKASTQWMVVGHSQGGQAALGAAQYASRAQLNYKGTVAVAPASNLRVILASGESQALGKTPEVQIPIYASLNSFTALIVAGIRNTMPNFEYSTVFQGQTLAVASQYAASECLFAIPPSPLSLPNALGQSMTVYATNNGSLQGYGRTVANFVTNATVATFLDQTSQPLQRNVATPVIIYQGQADTTVPFNATDKLVREARNNGNNITLNSDAAWTHATALSVNVNNSNILNNVKTLMPTTLGVSAVN